MIRTQSGMAQVRSGRTHPHLGRIARFALEAVVITAPIEIHVACEFMHPTILLDPTVIALPWVARKFVVIFVDVLLY